MDKPEERNSPFLSSIRIANKWEISTVKAIIISLLLLLAFLFALSLYQRSIHIDEATLGEQVYWLLEDGTVKSVLYTGIGTGLEDELLVYHKLFIWLSSGFAFLLGQSLALLRSLSLLFAILLGFTLYQYSKRCIYRTYMEESQKRFFLLFLMVLLLLTSNSLFFTYSFIFRPELMLTSLGFASFFMLAIYLHEGKLKYLWLAAILAGLAALTHLNGLVYMGAGGLLLLSERKIRPLLIFSVLSLLVLSFYFIDLLEPGAFDRFLLQFAGAPSFRTSDLHPLNRLLRVLAEHRRYFHSAREVAFTLFFVLTVAARFRFLCTKYSILMRYTLFGGITLAVINQDQTSKYALLLLPFACLLAALALMDILQEGNRKYIQLSSALFVVYFLIQLHEISGLITNKIDLPARNAEISQHIPHGSRVYGPGSFFFNEFEHYQLLSLESFYAQVSRFEALEYNKKDLFYHAGSLNCEYVILDLNFLADAAAKGIRPQELREGQTYYGYRVEHAAVDYFVMKRADDHYAMQKSQPQ